MHKNYLDILKLFKLKKMKIFNVFFTVYRMCHAIVSGNFMPVENILALLKISKMSVTIITHCRQRVK
jgi:hypothetical protein